MTRIKTIIVDDEKEAREGLQYLLESKPEFEVVEICKNGIEAIDSLMTNTIDLMFLDIQMPVVDGFEVINSIPDERLPEIIFTTAFDQYALKAFEVHAIDYLLKPFTDKRFFEALELATTSIENKQNQDQRRKLIKIVSDKNVKSIDGDIDPFDEGGKLNRLIVKENGRVHFIDLVDIRWIEAYDYYVKIHIENKYYLLRKSMKKLSALLPKDHFARIHKSSIINIQYIKHINLLGNGELEIELMMGTKLKVSRGFKDSIKHLL